MEKRAALEIEMSEVQNEINQLEQTLRSLQPLTGTAMPQETLAGMGMTDALCQVLIANWVKNKGNTEFLSATDIHKQMEEQGFSFANYSMPMASVYKVLERLEKKGKVEKNKK